MELMDRDFISRFKFVITPMIQLINPKYLFRIHFTCRDGDFDTTSIKISVPTFCSKLLKEVVFRTF